MMTEQIGNSAIAMAQAAALQMDPVKAAAKGDGESGGFQKLLTQKAQSAKSDAQPQEQEKLEDGVQAEEKQEGPVQEDAQTMAKRLAQMGLVMADTGVVQVAQEELPEAGEMQEEPLQVVSLEALPEGELVTAEFREDGPVQTFQAPIQEQPRQEEQPQAVEEARPEQEMAAVQPRQTQRTEDPETEQQVRTVHTEKAEVQAKEEPEAEVTEAEQAPQPVFRQVEAAPVKVGETYRTEDSQQVEEPDVTGQIDTQLTQAMERGESYVRIQLTPESLGSVTVEISQNADGALRVALSAHSSETRSLLERHSGALQGLLSSRTQQTVQVEVQRQQETQQGQDRHPYDGHNGHAQDQGESRQHRRQEHHSSQDFMQQLRLGLIPADAEEI